MTSGDRVEGSVLGKWTLNMEGFPRLKDVLHVDGLRANLISISQICDLNRNVNFTNEKCIVIDGFGNWVLEGSRYIDNCYTLSQAHIYHRVSINDTDLWYERLDHLNYKNMARIANAGVFCGLPTLGKKSPSVCGPCQLGK